VSDTTVGVTKNSPGFSFNIQRRFKETRQEEHEVSQILLGLSDSLVLMIPTELCALNSVQ
jgi:hypothetical protein